MKTLKIFSAQIIGLLSLLLIIASCNQEMPESTDASFTVSPDKLYVDSTVTIKMKSESDYMTIYNGEGKAVYADLESDTAHAVKGKTFNGKEYTFKYTTAGTYKITVISKNIGNFSNEEEEDIKDKSVTVYDARTSIESFSIGDFIGSFRGDTIILKMPANLDRDSLVATFETTSDSAQVFVGSKLQVSGETSNDFTSIVTYKVKAPDGSTYSYFIKINTFSASQENKLTGVEMPLLPSVSYNIDTTGTKDTVRLQFPWGAKSLTFYSVNVSSKAKYLVNGEDKTNEDFIAGDFSAPFEVFVEAENGDQRPYIMTATWKEDPFTSFKFENLNPVIVGNIMDSTITATVLEGTDTTNMVAYFYGADAATVRVNGKEQESGVTANDFSDTVRYNLEGNDGSEAFYDVIVNVAGL